MLGLLYGKRFGSKISSQTFSRIIPQHFSNLVHSIHSAYEDGTWCYETSAYKIQAPEKYPEERMYHSEHSESLKSRGLI